MKWWSADGATAIMRGFQIRDQENRLDECGKHVRAKIWGGVTLWRNVATSL